MTDTSTVPANLMAGSLSTGRWPMRELAAKRSANCLAGGHVIPHLVLVLMV
jgi:hypothetical protein